MNVSYNDMCKIIVPCSHVIPNNEKNSERTTERIYSTTIDQLSARRNTRWWLCVSTNRCGMSEIAYGRIIIEQHSFDVCSPYISPNAATITRRTVADLSICVPARSRMTYSGYFNDVRNSIWSPSRSRTCWETTRFYNYRRVYSVPDYVR